MEKRETFVGKDAPDAISMRGMVAPAVAMNQETGEQMPVLLVDVELRKHSTVNESNRTLVGSTAAYRTAYDRIFGSTN
ncbi:MAG: hypothetical protein PHU04_01645 [Candidatus Peribacteraceae bacterium]|nr:hypothetical protein [Candidatus Peribacteraceae bacterium]